MNYIIIDLEWNNAYAKKIKGFLNEIIEIGAVMLDDDLNEVSQYSTFIKAQISKKIRSNIKQLTHISNEDLTKGIPFTKAISELRRWIGSGENVVVTWSDGDIRALIENCRYLNGIRTIPFLSNHADLQSYYQSVIDVPDKNQISLSNAANLIGIDEGCYTLHRALDDSLLTADIFRKIFDNESFCKFIKTCDASFYNKLSFKPHYIGNIHNPVVKDALTGYVCDKCLAPTQQLSEWKFSSRYFRALFYCPECDEYTRVGVSIKKLYDRVEVKRTYITVLDYDKDSESGDNAGQI